MRTPLLAVLSVVTLLSGCAAVRTSPVNPFNWFGASKEKSVTTTPVEAGVIDDRPLMDQVSAMTVDKIPGGAIITAIGLPPRQGYWQAELIAENGGAPLNGVLSFQFRAYPPPVATPPGTDASREISAGIFMSDQALNGVREILVKAAQNQRSIRRK